MIRQAEIDSTPGNLFQIRPLRAPVIETYMGPQAMILHFPDRSISRELSALEKAVWSECSGKENCKGVTTQAVRRARVADDPQNHQAAAAFIVELIRLGFLLDKRDFPPVYPIPLGYEKPEGFASRTELFESLRPLAQLLKRACGEQACEIVHLGCGCGSFIRIASQGLENGSWHAVNSKAVSLQKARSLLSGIACEFHCCSPLTYPWTWRSGEWLKVCVLPISALLDTDVKEAQELKARLRDHCDMTFTYTLYRDWLGIGDLAAKADIKVPPPSTDARIAQILF